MFENDDIYDEYVKSAKFQRDLMIRHKKAGHKTWTMEHYKSFKQRKFQALINQKVMLLAAADVAKEMEKGDDKFKDNVPDKNYDKVLKELAKLKEE